MKLGLGTVQLGMDYGQVIPARKTPIEEAQAILTTASRNGIKVLDTARAYGTAEETLGCSLPPGHSFDIVTKVSSLSGKVASEIPVVLKDSLRASLRALRQPAVYGLLLHDASDLTGNNRQVVYETLQELRAARLVKKIGISAYTTDEIVRVLDEFQIDIVQAPMNVFDQRLSRQGTLTRLKAAAVEVHARSALLQGLVTITPEALPHYFRPMLTKVSRFHRWLKEHSLSPAEAAIAYACGSGADVVLCGVNDHLQLEQLCKAPQALVIDCLEELAVDDPQMIDPRCWPPGVAFSSAASQ